MNSSLLVKWYFETPIQDLYIAVLFAFTKYLNTITTALQQFDTIWLCRSAHHRHVTQERVSCICCVSSNQASRRHCEKLIFVDGVLCTLPWAGWVGSLLESPVCAHIEGDNYQTRSRQQRHKSRIDFLTAGRLQGMVPLPALPAHPAHPDHFSSLLRGRDVLFHNKTRNWLLSAPVNWT